MAILLDKAGTQHYANKMVLAENRKVGSKSLPSALADVDNLIEEMKGHFEAEYGSALDMKLENNENIFSVGTGSGLDKRSEVENSFTDVEVFGNSMTNLYKHKSFEYSSKVLEYKNGAEVLPNTTANFNYAMQLKPNTIYTGVVLVDVFTERMIIRFHTGDNSSSFYDITPNSNGKHLVKFTTTNTPTLSRGFVLNRDTSTSNCKISEIVILEGDYTSKPLPQYFEGLKSVGEIEGNKIEVSSVGKNLIDWANEPISTIGVNGKITKDSYGIIFDANNTSAYGVMFDRHVKLKPNTKYTFSSKWDVISGTPSYDNPYVRLENNTTGVFEGSTTGKYIFTTDMVGSYTLYLYVGSPNNGNAIVRFKEIQLEETSNLTIYEPYKIDKKEISLSAPLRGLPSGTKDSVEVINGEWKIVRRCGEIILSGDEKEKWESYYGKETPITEGFYLEKNSIYSTSTNELYRSLCDRFVVGKHIEQFDSGYLKDSEFITTTTDGRIAIRVNKSKLSSVNMSGFKQWLSQNPTKVIYELATPIIEDIDPITLQCWKNGTILIDSVIPPVTTHTVALNKPAQIKRNIEELTTLRHRVKTLEEQYDQIALEQAHKLELLNHSFELDYNI